MATRVFLALSNDGVHSIGMALDIGTWSLQVTLSHGSSLSLLLELDLDCLAVVASEPLSQEERLVRTTIPRRNNKHCIVY
eukprot:3098484-Amphidinium_carterae.1